MHPAPSNEPVVPGLFLKLTSKEAEQFVGKWVVVDEDGNVKAFGDSFDTAQQAAVVAGLDFDQVEFVCLPRKGLIG